MLMKKSDILFLFVIHLLSIVESSFMILLVEYVD